MLLFPRDAGVNSLPLYNMRGHSHLGLMGCTIVLLSLELERVLLKRSNEKKQLLQSKIHSLVEEVGPQLDATLACHKH